MNNGHGPKGPLETMLALQRHTQQQQVDPVQVFASFFGLNGPTLRAMQPNVVPCMCGRCQGVGVQLEVRLHFPVVGPPEFTTRGDAVKADAAAPAPAEKPG